MAKHQSPNDYEFNRKRVFSYMTDFQNPNNDGWKRSACMEGINDIFSTMPSNEHEQLITAMADRFQCLVATDEVEEYLTRYGLLATIAKPFTVLYTQIAEQNKKQS